MSLYQFREDRLEPVPATSFATEQLRERYDLQRMLRDQIEVIAPGTLVLAEEFSDWDESLRRIDLLCLDRQARLVVVELKATDTGGHMELQALRYAAMVSTLTFEQAVLAHGRYLRSRGRTTDPRQAILDFLGWEAEDGQRFASDVRIILASMDFSKELTTAVLWLNERDLDIRCIRLRPHRLDGSVLLDVQQIVPLPEAEEYQVRVRAKEQEERAVQRAKPDLAEVWKELEGQLSAEEVEVARALDGWFRSAGAHVFPLRRGFGFSFSASGEDPCYLCKVTTVGQIQVWFQYLANHLPFTDKAKRQELRERLNRIAGVAIPPERIGGKPTFPIRALAEPNAFAAFQSIWTWVIEQLSVASTVAPGEAS